MVNARVVGLMDMEDESGRDEKIIAVIAGQSKTEHIQDLEQVPAHLRREIEHFFENYKKLEMKKGKAKWAKVLGWGDKARALEVVNASREMHHNKYGAESKLHQLVTTPKCPSMLHVRQSDIENEIICYVSVSKGSFNSYIYRQDTTFRHYKYALDVPYPGDYGWVCQTWASDVRKPVEVLIISTFPVNAECLVSVRIVGGFERQYLKQGKLQTDCKVIGVTSADPRMAHVKAMKDFNPQVLRHYENFFMHSAESSGGSDAKITRRLETAEMIAHVQACNQDYLKNFTDCEVHNAPNLWCLPWESSATRGDPGARVYPCIIECSKHTSNKYVFNADYGVLNCEGPLQTSSFWPGNYGFIPQTVAEHGRPVEVMALSTVPLRNASVAEIRIVGAAECVDEMGPIFKMVGVPKSEPRMAEWTDIEAVPKHIKDEMVHFFNAYKDLEPDWKFCRFERWLDASTAMNYVQSAHSRFFLFVMPMQRVEKRLQALEDENMSLRAALAQSGGYPEAVTKPKRDPIFGRQISSIST